MTQKQLKPIRAVEIVSLGIDDEPPRGSSFVLVSPGSMGGFEVKGYALRDSSATLYLASAPEGFDVALASARRWAESHGVQTIYVSG